MNSVSVFVKTLVVLTFLWCVAECILPDKSIRKFTSYIYGIIVISMVLSVVTSINYDSFYINDFNVSTGVYDDYLINLYEERLESVFAEKFGDTSIDVELTPDGKIKNIYCDNKKTYDDIVRYLNESN